jgi:hypothetical protein
VTSRLVTGRSLTFFTVYSKRLESQGRCGFEAGGCVNLQSTTCLALTTYEGGHRVKNPISNFCMSADGFLNFCRLYVAKFK